MSLKITAAAALLLVSSASTLAFDSLRDDQDFWGRSEASVIASLSERDINVEHIEKWGDAIRVFAIDENGSNQTFLVDKSTLHPLASGNGVAVRRDVAPRSTSPSLSNFDQTPRSLVESDDDGE
jgi:hypothetical protein